MSSAAYFRAAAMSGGAAVLLGAFGAHGLKSRGGDAAALATWSTSAQYHLVHAAALGLAALSRGRGAAGGLPCALLASGTALFSGSLYLLVLTGQKSLGAITPIGGLLLTAGWVALAWEAPAALSR